MTRLELTPEEQELLGQVLRNYLATLEVEICHTDHSEFRSLLKQRRELLNRLLARLGPAGSATA